MISLIVILVYSAGHPIHLAQHSSASGGERSNKNNQQSNITINLQCHVTQGKELQWQSSVVEVRCRERSTMAK